MIRRLRIAPRLIFAFTLLIILMFIATSAALWQVSVLSNELQRVSQIDAQANTVLRVYNQTLAMQQGLRTIAQNEDLTLLVAEGNALADSLSLAIDNAITELAQNESEEAEHLIEELSAIRAAVPSQLENLVALGEANDWLAVQLRIENQFAETINEAEHITQKMDAAVTVTREGAMINTVETQQSVAVTIITLGLLTVLAAVMLGFMVIQSIAQPVTLLDKAAQAWSRGDLRYRVEIDGDDELAHLGSVFNAGASRLANLYTNLETLIQDRTTELEHRAVQLETSAAVAQRVASILDLDQLLPQVTQLIKNSFNMHYVGVFLVNDDRNIVSLRSGSHEVNPLQLTIDNNSIVGWVAKYRRAVLSNDVSKDKRYFLWKEVPDTKSELALPLVIGDEILGVLDLQSDQRNKFQQEDIPVLQSLADQVSIAIKNASIYQGEQSQRYLAETLQQVGRALTSTLNLNEVLDLILERLKPLIPHDRGSVLLWNGRELEIKAARGFPEGFNPLETRVPIHSADPQDVFVTIYRTKQPFMIENVAEYPSWKQVNNLQRPGSWMGVPIIRENMVIGMLSLTKDEVHAYSEHDAAVATAIAAQAAVALENAQLYERIKRFSEQLEYEVQNRTEALQGAYEQLERLDRTKSSFISIASHELRTPITVLKGYSQILLKDPIIKENEYYSDMLAGIRNGAVRLHEIVDNMLDMAKIDGRTLQLYPEPLSMAKLVGDVISGLEEGLQDRQLSLTITPRIDNLPLFEADHDGIKKVLYHLIVNAIKYTPNGGDIVIDGRSWMEAPDNIEWPDMGVELVIRDSGIGIAPENLDVIFNKFYQTGEVALHSTGKTKFKGGGPGLGLAIVKGIVTAHRGHVWADSQEHDESSLPGSTFHVVLPLRQEQSQPIAELEQPHPLL